MVGWIRSYDRRCLRGDLIAGTAVAALIVPKNLGYAAIAGVPLQNGLYAAAAGAILYAVFGTSRQISTGPSSGLAATDLTINGHGGQPAVDGNHASGVFSVKLGAVHDRQRAGVGDAAAEAGCLAVLDGEALDGGRDTVRNNSTTVDCSLGPCISLGGGILNNGGTLTVMNSTLSGNATGGDPNTAIVDGGGIFNVPNNGNFATLTVSNSTLSGNTSPFGGAIANTPGFGGTVDSATATVNNSTLSGNSVNGPAGTFGGGAILNAGAMTVNNSTLSGNSATKGGDGGAIVNFGGSLSIRNSRLSGNVGRGGGAIENTEATLTMTNSLVSGNTGVLGGGLYQCVGSATVGNSRFSANPDSSLDSPPGVFKDPGCRPSTFTATNSTFS